MSASSHPLIGKWLLLGVIMIVIQILLGGITRLTGSGLSITEWNVILGVIPPLNTGQWEQAFDQYKQFPQYRILNSDMDLSGFKRIFWWEYIHRLWGRLLAPVFLLPLVWFLWKRQMPRRLLWQLLGLFVLGAMQGFVGWIMVASGLVDQPWVDPLKLSIHLLLALLLLSLLFLLTLRYLPAAGAQRNRPLQRLAVVLLLLLTVQYFFGGLMAGYKAGVLYPTFPRMGEHWIPPGIGSLKPFWLNLVENTGTIHFMHRLLGYLIAVTAIAGFFLLIGKVNSSAQRRAVLLLPVATIIQVALGIATVLHATGHIPLWWASAHQMTGVLLLLIVLWLLHLSRGPVHPAPAKG
ncbi:MAG: COX15/CtaA family protein [Chitinophagales bacterium]|nr:COX15/CtaA family protein [Chitinophagales bacterium]MDW8394527.1 COX15/CtaA family protein [Chitinophagales bacterium]